MIYEKKNLFIQICPVALFLIGAKVVSAYDFAAGGIYYGITGTNDVYVTNNGSVNSYSGSVTIPSQVTYNGKTYNVVQIGYQAFKGSTGLTSVTMPNTIIYISNDAFYGCTALTTIKLPSSISAIYNNVFVGCTGLTSVYCEW